jgi:hypothetical protein
MVTDDVASSSMKLTTYGYAFLTRSQADHRYLLQRRLQQCEPTKSIIQLLRLQGRLTKCEIALVHQNLAPLSDNTAARRAATICAWLRDLEIAAWNQDGCVSSQFRKSAMTCGGRVTPHLVIDQAAINSLIRT